MNKKVTGVLFVGGVLIVLMFQNCGKGFETAKVDLSQVAIPQNLDDGQNGSSPDKIVSKWTFKAMDGMPYSEVSFLTSKVSTVESDLKLEVVEVSKIKTLSDAGDFLKEFTFHTPKRLAVAEGGGTYSIVFLNDQGDKILKVSVLESSIELDWVTLLPQKVSATDFTQLTVADSVTGKNLKVGPFSISNLNATQPEVRLTATPNCTSSQHIEGNQCVANVKPCAITNASATQTWNGTSYGACTVASCFKGYTKSGNTCVATIPVATCTGGLGGTNINRQGYYYDLAKINKNFPVIKRAFTCPTILKAPAKFDPPVFYLADGVTPNPAYYTHMVPFRQFQATLNQIGDEYLIQGGNDQVAACLMNWIYAWSSSGLFTEHNAAELGRTNYTTTQGDYDRVDMVLSVVLNMLKIKNAKVSDVQRAAGVAWMGRTMSPMKLFYTNRIRLKADGKMDRPENLNNHHYWAGAAIFAYGVLAPSLPDRVYGLQAYQLGIDSIRDDGTLATEMARGVQAFIYHQYALQPLVMIAELRSVQLGNATPYDYSNKRLNKLISLVKNAYLNPAYFAKVFPPNQKQTPGSMLKNLPYYLDWMETYHSRFNDVQLVPLIKQARASGSGMLDKRLGGQMDLSWGVANCRLSP